MEPKAEGVKAVGLGRKEWGSWAGGPWVSPVSHWGWGKVSRQSSGKRISTCLLASRGCWNKWPQPGYLKAFCFKTVVIYSFTAVWARLCSLTGFQLLVPPGVPYLWLQEFKLRTVSTWPSLSASFLMRTLVIGFRAHLDNPRQAHLKTLTWITSAKTPFPNKVTHRFRVNLSFGEWGLPFNTPQVLNSNPRASSQMESLSSFPSFGAPGPSSRASWIRTLTLSSPGPRSVRTRVQK